jgi:asparagine synthase (glutamine-hydrolysing)
MSGIYGFAAPKGISDPEALLRKMDGAVPCPGPVVKHEWTDKAGYVGLGALHPTRIGRAGHYAENPSAGVYCIFDGVIYRNGSTAGEGLVELDGASLLLEHYLKSGADRLSQYNGSFVAAWWDDKARRLLVANDKVGQRLLFFGWRNGMFAFSSLLARVMASGCVSSQIDLEAFADLINYEHVIGRRTLFKDVQILPVASVLTYERGQVSIKKYWQIDEIEPHGQYDKQRLDELTELFKGAVKRAARPDMAVAIDLTGGLDSRCMLAAAVHMRLPIVTHTGGQPDSTDVVLAQQAAAKVGVKHIFEPVGPEKVAEWLVPMVRYQGGIIATLHSHPCQHFEMELPFDAVLQGIGINYMRGLWVTPTELNKITSLSAAQDLLKRNISSTTARKMNPEGIWKSELHRLGVQVPDSHLRSLFDEYKRNDGFVGVLDSISLQERTRKFLNKAIMIVRAAREVYYPYLDHELLVALAQLPTAERVKNRIQIDMIRRFAPELLGVPYEKNLIPMSASPTRVWMTLKYRGVKRRISKQLRLPNLVPAKVPTHYYSEWIRKEMRKVLVDLLYNPKAAFRAYLNWQVVEELLNQHFSGQANWESLVGALTVFEISHRLWVDPDPRLHQAS